MPKTTWEVIYSPTGELKDITGKEFDNEQDAKEFAKECKMKGYGRVTITRDVSYEPGEHWYFR